ncbi:MAG TPA: hypothetical protein VMZ31_19945 [Phycisphaerae bacterium]|nr:hypothetical protein [Phycisphaerae bacterium]
MQEQFVLTVPEGKRLIARAVGSYPPVKQALGEGTVIICTGSTNAYVYEELTGQPIEKWRFITGHMVPSRGIRGSKSPSAEIANLVIRRGKPDRSADWLAALADLGPGDVILKGANALNYERRQAAVLIGHPEGGTVGSIVGIAVARRVQLIHPVGLEKSVPGDLQEAAASIASATDGFGKRSSTLWVSWGQVFTEIEALETLCQVRATPIGAGGLGGAEGCIRLLVEGAAEQVTAAGKLIEQIAGEPGVLM